MKIEVDNAFSWILMGSFSTVLLLSGILAAWPQEVPVLDLNPICRGIAQGAAGAGERGGPDLSFARCVRSEQATKKKTDQDVVEIRPAR